MGQYPARGLDKTDSNRSLPAGIITFLFTDIEGSTPLWESRPAEMHLALEQHNIILYAAIAENGGIVVKTIGDAFQAAFSHPDQAILAAVAAQRNLAEAAWGGTGALRVRVGIHTGPAEASEGDYIASHTLNRVARIMSAGHGGQVLISASVVELLHGSLPVGITLRDLGEHHLKGMLLPEHIFQVVTPGLPADFPPLNSLEQPVHNLPLQLTSFIGREAELSQIKDRLTQARLVTLTGSGGVGKTRLSLRVAEELITDFPDGVWLVELASLGEPELILQAITSLFHLRLEPNRPLLAVLLDYLRGKSLLLLLDNCEHLIEGCAELAEAILRSCPRVHILASSREALGVPGEMTFYVPSLPSPDPQHLPDLESLKHYAAVQLFRERAIEAQPNFAITEKNAESLARLCRRLDGIPLALELAAARLRVLSLEQIASRLDDRFRLLSGGSRRALPRHQTLHALIDWSFSLLSETEKALFRRLSTFAGGWTLDAAESICAGAPIASGDILDLLSSLVSKSLVSVEVAEGEVERYRMLETIRQFAQEKLVESGEAELFRDAHLDYYTRFSLQRQPTLHSKAALRAIEQIDAEIDNLRIALGWAIGENANRTIQGIRLNSALNYYWNLRDLPQEGSEWSLKGARSLPRGEAELESIRAEANINAVHLFLVSSYGTSQLVQDLLEESILVYQRLDDRKGVVQAQAYKAMGMMVSFFGQPSAAFITNETYIQALELAEKSLAASRDLADKLLLMKALYCAGAVRLLGADYTTARPYFTESLSLAQELEDPVFQGWLLNGLGAITLYQEDYAASRKMFLASIEWSARLGYRQGEAASIVNLGTVAYLEQDYTQMEAWFQKSLTLATRINLRLNIIFSLRMLGYAALLQGQFQRATYLFLESLPVAKEMDDGYGERAVLVGMAGVALAKEQPERAARLLGAVEAQFESFIKPLDRWEQIQVDRIEAECRQQLAEAEFRAALESGGRMRLDQAVNYARETAVL